MKERRKERGILMTDEEFKQLEEDLRRATNTLNRLQEQYKNETGRYWVMPINYWAKAE